MRRTRGCAAIDCQVRSEHLLSLGAREIPADQFRRLLAEGIQTVAPTGRWDNFTFPEPLA
jgi:leucyl/phenylalanyl-tRNA--protein transferase